MTTLCHGLRFDAERNGIKFYTLDTRQYTHHPAERIINGENQGAVFTSGNPQPFVAISRIEMIGNGDEEWQKGCLPFGEMSYGNLYVEISPASSPAECPSWSPLRPTPPNFCVGLRSKALEAIEQWSENSDDVDIPFPAKLKAGTSVTAIFPGPFPTHPPKQMPEAYPQCEWGLDFQSVTYDPPKPMFPENDPLFQSSAYYCLRVAEGDKWRDTPILQTAISKEMLKQRGKITLAHNPRDPRSVWVDEAEEAPSLFKIEMQWRGGFIY